MDFNSWTADGIVEVRLLPNQPIDGNGTPLSGQFGINDICGSSFARARLRYIAQTPDSTLTLSYSINNGAEISPIPAVDTFGLGAHQVKYFVSDPGGAKDSCLFDVVVEDNEPPLFVDCPADTLDIVVASCDTTMSLPHFGFIQDNCMALMQKDSAISKLMTFNGPDNSADNMQFVFENAGQKIASDAVLTVTVWGDIDQVDEFFVVRNETGAVLTQTITGGNCGDSTTRSLVLSRQILLDWALDGQITFDLIPNIAPNPTTAGPDGDPNIYAINNHCPGVSSGLRRVEVRLTYGEYPNLQYAINGVTSVPVTTYPDFGVPEVQFNLGISRLEYTIQDDNGNAGVCAFYISVFENEPPVINCAVDISIELNPSGIVADTIHINDLIQSVTDNCGSVTTTLSDSLFSCDQLSNSPISGCHLCQRRIRKRGFLYCSNTRFYVCFATDLFCGDLRE